MARITLLIALSLLVVGCSATPRTDSHTLEIRPASYEQLPGSVAYTDPYENKTIYVSGPPIITNKDITSARRTKAQLYDAPAIELEVTEEAGERMLIYTKNNIQGTIAIMLDGELIWSPTIMSGLSTHFVINGGIEGLPPDQTQKILSIIKAH